MHLRLIALLLLLLNAQNAAAKCIYIAACFQVAGVVAKCDSVRVDGANYLRLQIPDVEASVSVCPTPPERQPEQGETAQALSQLSSRHTYFIAKPESSTCRTINGTHVTGRVSHHCCDTVPRRGQCKLTAPLLVPLESSEP